MGWETRQNRLNTLFGKNNHLCFQVIACYMPPDSHDPKKFDALCKKHNITIEAASKMEVFDTRYKQLYFPIGFVDLGKNGEKISYEPKIEVLYSTTNKNTIEQMLQDDNLNENNPLLQKIATLFEPPIKSHFKNAEFRGLYTELSSDKAMIFQFIIHPYCPSLCHPNDLEKLKPITIIDGHVIEPTHSRIDHLKLQI